MIRLLVSLVLMVASNAVGLAIATALLPDLTVDASGFVLAVGLLSVVEVLGNPLLAQISMKYIPALRGSFALVTTFIGVWLIDFLLDGVSVPNIRTWLLATLIIWAGALIATMILPFIFVKKAVRRTAG